MRPFEWWILVPALLLPLSAGCEMTAGVYVEKDTFLEASRAHDPDLRTSLKLEWTERNLFGRR